MVNEPTEMALSPPESLAIAYAPRLIREDFRWLVAFDHKLREVLERAREPMIAQLRLAWWRDVLQKPAEERPKGEPLLARLGDQRESLAILAAAMVDAYEAMIGAPERDDLLPLFAAYARLIEASAEELADVEKLAMGRSIVSSRKLRPISILALAKRLETSGSKANGLRLSWHALTGR